MNADDCLANWTDPKAWTHIQNDHGTTLHPKAGESYLRLPNGLMAIFRGFDPLEAAFYVQRCGYPPYTLVATLTIVPLGPYLTGQNPTELHVDYNGKTWHITGSGFRGQSIQPSLQAALDEAKRHPRFFQGRFVEWLA
jgi:hypothetical protein